MPTKSSTAITLLSMVILRLPLAWWLAAHLGYGAVGGWWAMGISTAVQGILTILVFRRGHWRTVKV